MKATHPGRQATHSEGSDYVDCVVLHTDRHMKRCNVDMSVTAFHVCLFLTRRNRRYCCNKQTLRVIHCTLTSPCWLTRHQCQCQCHCHCHCQAIVSHRNADSDRCTYTCVKVSVRESALSRPVIRKTPSEAGKVKPSGPVVEALHPPKQRPVSVEPPRVVKHPFRLQPVDVSRQDVDPQECQLLGGQEVIKHGDDQMGRGSLGITLKLLE
mmetsp:Transcript_37745/g.94647  ORF Transcript_37745/g.94647 Transcript_37745/m.94647 type:complete len:210 (-) Transcript_37745:515-1144(-)